LLRVFLGIRILVDFEAYDLCSFEIMLGGRDGGESTKNIKEDIISRLLLIKEGY